MYSYVQRLAAAPSLDTPRLTSPLFPATPSRSWPASWCLCALAGTVTAVLSILMVAVALMTSAGQHAGGLPVLRMDRRAGRPDVVVMYIFSNTDPEYLNNLKFFLREGVHPADGCEYLFVVNGSPGEGVELPDLPANARYVHHANECYDWGTFGWAILTQSLDLSRYKYFIFMNSSVRGPFFPSYLRGHVHWSDVLLSKVTDTVKLVGPTINCEGSPPSGNVDGEWRRNPHVQSYLVATDRVGLQLLLNARDVFKCYESMWDTIYYSELGSSKAILDAGYNIDSLMVRYQGVDWRDPANWGCNAQRNPYGAHYLDGGSLEAMEVMFVKVKDRHLRLNWPYPVNARLYDTWYQARDEGRPEVHRNVYDTDAARFRLPFVLSAAAIGPACFDCGYYAAANPDIPTAFDCEGLFDHFINNGQFEGRDFKYTCNVPEAELLPFHAQPGGSMLPQLSEARMGEVIHEAQQRADADHQAQIHGRRALSGDSDDLARSEGGPVAATWGGEIWQAGFESVTAKDLALR